MKSHAVLSLKGLAIIGVVFHHISNRRLDASVTDSLAVVEFFFSWAVLLFVAVSGWLHAVSDENRSVQFLDFLKSRFVRLIVPYVLLVILYAFVWQALQWLGFSGVGVRLSDSLLAKVYCSISPSCYQPVAEQLYFLPVLFVVAIISRFFCQIFGRVKGSGLLMVLALALGVGMVPEPKNTGFNQGFFLFALYCYASAYLLRTWREDKRCIPFVLIGVAVVLFLLKSGGVPKVLPVLLIAGIGWLEQMRFAGLQSIGAASGTIFAYHTPFVLQPIMLVVSKLPANYQFVGAIFSALAVVFLLTVLYHLIRRTRLRVFAL